MTAAQLAPAQAPNENQKAYRDTLITEHLHLVTAIASHMQRSMRIHMELDDLIHAGTMGLIEAATHYREDKEAAFPTYAKHRIRGAVLDSLRERDWASRDLRARYKQVENVTAQLSAELGRTPTEIEIADAIGVNSKRWQALMVDFRNLNAAALQTHSAGDEDQLAPEIAASSAYSPESMFARTELRGKLSSALESLPEKYRAVVKLYYHKQMTMKEIGTKLGVNESRVSQIHKGALERMQATLGTLGVCSAAAF